MIDLLAIYECSNCGEVLEDQVCYIECIDIENDDIYPVYQCKKCYREVRPKMSRGNDGEMHQWFQSVDHERWLWAQGFFDDDEREDDYE